MSSIQLSLQAPVSYETDLVITAVSVMFNHVITTCITQENHTLKQHLYHRSRIMISFKHYLSNIYLHYVSNGCNNGTYSRPQYILNECERKTFPFKLRISSFHIIALCNLSASCAHRPTHYTLHSWP